MENECRYEMYKCVETPIEGDEHCIFHSKREKDVAEFKSRLEKITIGDFIGFVFPRSITCEEFHGDVFNKSADGILTSKTNIDFTDATFQAGCIFSNAIFDHELNLSDCKFYGKCHFDKSRFNKKVTINGMKCNGELSFEGARFSDEGFCYEQKNDECIKKETWDKNVKQKEKEGIILFSEVKITKPENVRFQGVDLSRWSFINTDVTKIFFRHCKWTDAKPIKGRFSGIILYDEMKAGFEYRPGILSVRELLPAILPHKGAARNPKLIGPIDELIRLYRMMSQSFERQHLHHKTSDFHIGEMEMRRLLLWHNKNLGISRFITYFLTWFYKAVSVYGERPLRVLLWLVLGIFFLFPILYCFTGGVEIVNDPKKPASLLNILAYSFEVMVMVIRDKHFVYVSDGGWAVFALESLTGLILIPLFILALRRFFKRQKVDSDS